jgi:hypothetical protein
MMGGLIVAVLFGLLAFYWGKQFIRLMLLSGEDFPYAYDKILWVSTFCLLPPLAPFVFNYWMQAYTSMRQIERDENAHKQA